MSRTLPRPCTVRSEKEVSSSGGVVNKEVRLDSKNRAYCKGAILSLARRRTDHDVAARRAQRQRGAAAANRSSRAVLVIGTASLHTPVLDRDASVGPDRIQRVAARRRRDGD